MTTPGVVQDLQVGSVSLDQRYGSLFQGFQNGTLSVDRYGPTTKWGLSETPSLFDYMGTIIVESATSKARWVNGPKCMPVRQTNSIAHKFTLVRFGKNPFPEPTPEGSVGRLLRIEKEDITFTSVRYQHGFEFSYERFQLPEGQEDFIVFSEKLSDIFEMNMNFESIREICRPPRQTTALINMFNTGMNLLRKEKMMREVLNFGQGNERATGYFNGVWALSEEMKHLNNGQYPNIVIMDGKKQALIKTGNALTYDYQHAGPEGPKRLMSQGMIGKLSENLEVFEMPVYATDMYNGKYYNMLSNEVTIAEHFVNENDRFLEVSPEHFHTEKHAAIKIFSQPDNDYVKISVAEQIENCGRWADDAEGTLVNGVPAMIHGDAFYRNSTVDPVPCATISEIEEQYQDGLKPWYDAVASKLKFEMDKYTNTEDKVDVFNDLLGLSAAEGLISGEAYREAMNVINNRADAADVKRQLLALLKDAYARMEKHVELRDIIPNLGVAPANEITRALNEITTSSKRLKFDWMMEYIGKIRITKKNFLRLAKENVPLPVRFGLFRLYNVFRMSNIVALIGGVGFGECLVGHQHASFEWTGKTGVGEVQFAMHVAPVIYDEKRKSVLFNMFFDGVLGGGGRRFYTEEDRQLLLNNNWTSDHMKRPDLWCVMELWGSPKWNHEYVHAGGRADFDHPNDLNYPSADFYGWRYNFHQLPSVQNIYYSADERVTPQVNPLSYQGSQLNPDSNGEFKIRVKNRGHLKEEYPGVVDVYRDGTLIKKTGVV